MIPSLSELFPEIISWANNNTPYQKIKKKPASILRGRRYRKISISDKGTNSRTDTDSRETRFGWLCAWLYWAAVRRMGSTYLPRCRLRFLSEARFTLSNTSCTERLDCLLPITVPLDQISIYIYISIPQNQKNRLYRMEQTSCSRPNCSGVWPTLLAHMTHVWHQTPLVGAHYFVNGLVKVGWYDHHYPTMLRCTFHR